MEITSQLNVKNEINNTNNNNNNNNKDPVRKYTKKDFLQIRIMGENANPEKDTYFLIWVIRVAFSMFTDRIIPRELIGYILGYRIYTIFNKEKHLKVYPWYTLVSSMGLRPTSRKFKFVT